MPASASACCVDAAAAVPPPFTSWDSTLPPTAAISGHLAWTPAHSGMLYRVDRWGAPYFTVNSNGNISIRPFGDATLGHQEIDLLKVVKKASDPKSSGGLGLQLPLVVRFPDVLKNRLESLQSSFSFAIESQGYKAHYQGVYPVKCNQDKYVVEDIVNFGSDFLFGLEAGSKPELLLAMSCLCNGSPEALLVCNGFKDAEYISIALVARKLHLNTVIVLEQEEELDIVIEVSKRLCVRPVIGVRAKLRTKHSGHFGSSSGEKGKFGLTTTQLLRVVKKLQVHDMLDCLELLHFHIGSQIPTTWLLADGVGRSCSDSRSQDSDVSVAYSLEEYASAVVQSIRVVCDQRAVKHPVICSESWRAIVSHHSILVFEAVSSSSHPRYEMEHLEGVVERLSEGARADYLSLCAAAMSNDYDYDTCMVHAEQLKERCIDEFKDGCLGMEQLATVDSV